MTNYSSGDRNQIPTEGHSAPAQRGNRLTKGRSLLAAALLAVSLQAAATNLEIDGTYVSLWNPTGQEVGYLFAGFVTRQFNPAVPDLTTGTVGAQINAGNAAGVNQGVWGIATEAWAYPGSRSPLFGIEATTINMEPGNAQPKAAFYATFKDRPDYAYDAPPADPMNLNSEALLIDGQPGTGFERGIVFGPDALSPSPARATPAAIDLSEMSLADVQKVDLIRFPDGCSLVYLGHGQLGTRCDATAK